MLWVYLSLLASLCWATGNIISKYSLSKISSETATVAMLLTSPLIVLILGLVFPILFSPIAIFSGILWYLGYYAFYCALNDGEVSKMVGLLLTSPIFTAIFSAMVLGEILTPVQYFGIILAVIGAVMISFEWESRKIGKGVVMIILSSILYAISDVATKMALDTVDPISNMFWIAVTGTGMLVLGGVVWRKKIDFKSTRYMKFMLTTAILSNLGAYLFIVACSLAFVSLVTAINTSQAMFAFIGAVIVTRLNPKLLQEDMGKKSLIKKAMSIILLIFGVILVVV